MELFFKLKFPLIDRSLHRCSIHNSVLIGHRKIPYIYIIIYTVLPAKTPQNAILYIIIYTVLPAKTPQNAIVCLFYFPKYSAQLVPKVHIKMITNLH